MNSKLLAGVLAMLAASLILSGCGGGGQSNPSVATPQPQTLDTTHVLAIARSASESTDPLPVDGGALLVADANDDSSAPLPVI
jgi:ABC-type glycerol-3-phosphate transport system substrate-binding protein